MGSSKRQEDSASANNAQGKLPPALEGMFHRALAQFCVDMNVSSDIVQDEEFCAALQHMVKTTQMFGAMSSPQLAFGTDMEDGPFRNLGQIIAKYKN